SGQQAGTADARRMRAVALRRPRVRRSRAGVAHGGRRRSLPGQCHPASRACAAGDRAAGRPDSRRLGRQADRAIALPIRSIKHLSGVIVMSAPNAPSHLIPSLADAYDLIADDLPGGATEDATTIAD